MSLLRLASFLVLAPLAACVASSSSVTVVVSSPPGIDCTITSGATTGTCSAAFADFTVVTLTATPAGDSSFEGWLNLASGDDFDYEQTLGFQNQPSLATNPLAVADDQDRTLVVLSSFTTAP
ncbi:MAG TPA: hypothetical protein VH143_15390 [Kofleriaceae bacterium]|jgi:hypothetical protein|nr:hypothetical protein [Kofleriaceae bacterium]